MGNPGYNPVLVLPQFVHSLREISVASISTHWFSNNQGFSSLITPHRYPQEFLGKKQGLGAYLSAFPQSLLLPLLFVYIRKDT